MSQKSYNKGGTSRASARAIRPESQRGGFTLIELLVVIAIIGILAGIILVSLNGARQKANTAAIKANLAGARNAMEIYYSSNNNNSYDGTPAICSSNNAAAGTDLLKYMTNEKPVSGTDYHCVVSSDSYWLAGGPLPGEAAAVDHWCVSADGANMAVPLLTTGC